MVPRVVWGAPCKPLRCPRPRRGLAQAARRRITWYSPRRIRRAARVSSSSTAGSTVTSPNAQSMRLVMSSVDRRLVRSGDVPRACSLVIALRSRRVGGRLPSSPRATGGTSRALRTPSRGSPGRGMYRLAVARTIGPKPILTKGPQMHKPNALLESDVRTEMDIDPLLDDTQVMVSAKDGAVTLTGAVPTYYDTVRATEDTWRVGGVRDVDNQLLVGLVGESIADGD